MPTRRCLTTRPSRFFRSAIGVDLVRSDAQARALVEEFIRSH
jgi:hypothetical protein